MVDCALSQACLVWKYIKSWKVIVFTYQSSKISFGLLRKSPVIFDDLKRIALRYCLEILPICFICLYNLALILHFKKNNI